MQTWQLPRRKQRLCSSREWLSLGKFRISDLVDLSRTWGLSVGKVNKVRETLSSPPPPCHPTPRSPQGTRSPAVCPRTLREDGQKGARDHYRENESGQAGSVLHELRGAKNSTFRSTSAGQGPALSTAIRVRWAGPAERWAGLRGEVGGGSASAPPGGGGVGASSPSSHLLQQERRGCGRSPPTPAGGGCSRGRPAARPSGAEEAEGSLAHRPQGAELGGATPEPHLSPGTTTFW